MHNILLLDFASEMNRGDAAMQEAILDIVEDVYPNAEKSIVSVYGENQETAFKDHFDCSALHDVDIYPGVRNSFNPLSSQFKNLGNKKLRSLFGILFAYFQLVIYFLSLKTIFFGPGKRALSKIASADAVLWNGRNFRNRNGIGEIYDMFAMLLHPFYCLVLKKKTYAIGVSIWPLRYAISRIMLRFVLSRCVYVTARESYSLEYAQKKLGLKNVKLAPDLSFYFINKYRNEDDIARDPKLVSFTLVDWKESGLIARQRYKDSIAALMKHLLCAGYRVQVVPQVYYEWEGYVGLLSEIYQEHPDLNGKLIEIKSYLSPKELFAEYRKSACLIATRMHSAIFALTHMCKVICVPYDAGAKWHIVSDMGLDAKYMINYSEIAPKVLVDAFENIINDNGLHDKIVENLPALISGSSSPIEGVLKSSEAQ
ncbi:polysaccharide pyruvyl transferase family protein [Teredinibacter turnerae]|uniref:polysaccharide pyruvyl transferase family protein n=1 Tax=Teredinibacter turnerae TaxID=2426 RepID=UPI00037FC49C|nr:polysaccharide pyruvyl transferase family protein [Teredinibacter turnerae]